MSEPQAYSKISLTILYFLQHNLFYNRNKIIFMYIKKQRTGLHKLQNSKLRVRKIRTPVINLQPTNIYCPTFVHNTRLWFYRYSLNLTPLHFYIFNSHIFNCHSALDMLIPFIQRQTLLVSYYAISTYLIHLGAVSITFILPTSLIIAIVCTT
jgi:hypothetical protein